jgi:serine/threonine protein kinase
MAKSTKKRTPQTILRLPDLEQSKSAVLNSLISPCSRRSYEHAIRDFIAWYYSEPRLATYRRWCRGPDRGWSGARRRRRQAAKIWTREQICFPFGAVLYEMATGVLPFHGETPALIFDAILNREPVPVLRLNRNVPPRLDDIIAKALEKNRARRYQTAAEMRRDLQRLKRDLESGRSAVSNLPAEAPSSGNGVAPISSGPSPAAPIVTPPSGSSPAVTAPAELSQLLRAQ